MKINKIQHYTFGLVMLTSVIWADRLDYDNARDLAINAEKSLNTQGTDVFKSINERKEGFYDTTGKLYIFVIDDKDKVIANGGNQDAIGNDVKDIKLDDGKTLADRIDEIKDLPQGQGWAGYLWEPADSDTKMSKQSYLIYNKEHDVVIGSGAYK